SIQRRSTDTLRMYDYLWRWDTDWFWCSRAFGAQHPLVRRVWPRRYRRSDVYHRLVGLEDRFGVAARIDRARGLPQRERVIQDIEVSAGRLGEFMSWFHDHVGMSPVWLCPLRLRRGEGHPPRTWPLYPLDADEIYVNVGFWGTVPIAPGAQDGDVNRAIEQRVTELGGHKSLYSDAYYDRETFDRLYDGETWAKVKSHYDPEGRLTGMYEKAVRRR
ncbi:MAG: FAD-binding protein, partial [Actinomycetia bacterium]|nr:FAD-binding protein [Actinomycetes bacterium]